MQWALHEAPMLRTPSGEPDVAARFVLVARAERADKDGRNTFAGRNDVARSTGYAERTVRHADQRLEEAGLLVRGGVSRLGTVLWHLDMTRKQSDTDSSPTDDRAERKRKANADRQQRFRDRVKGARPIEVDVPTKIDVTPLKGVSNAVEGRYVTPFNGTRNAPDAPQTTHEPPEEPPEEPPTGGAPPPDPLRPQPPTASGSGTGERNSLSEALTARPSPNLDPLPHARADQTADRARRDRIRGDLDRRNAAEKLNARAAGILDRHQKSGAQSAGPETRTDEQDQP